MVDTHSLIQWAKEQAETHLPVLEKRWLHVQGVVARTQGVISLFNNEEDQAYLIAAAYVHDIGYAPTIKKTGFHPLDGALYLKSLNQERLASLVAYHSGAIFEAQQRGLEEELAQFPEEHSLVADALTYCDMTTGPTGQLLTFQERIDDILSRYDETSIVARSIQNAQPALAAMVERVQQEIT